MGNEKPEDVRERNAHRLVVGGRVVAVLSVLFLVPFLRRRREQQEQRKQQHGRWHGRFAVPGH